MTCRDRPVDPEPEEQILLVGVCVGMRCAAVRRLAAERLAQDGRELIRAAVRSRPDAVMVDLPCPGLCSHGAVAVVGSAKSRRGRLAWVSPPTWVPSTDAAQRGLDVAAWIAHGAPDPRTFPHHTLRP